MDEKRAALCLKIAEEQFPSLGTEACRFVDGYCEAGHQGYGGRRAEEFKPLPLGLVCAIGLRVAEGIERDGRSYNRMKAVDAIAADLMADLWPSTSEGGEGQ